MTQWPDITMLAKSNNSSQEFVKVTGIMCPETRPLPRQLDYCYTWYNIALPHSSIRGAAKTKIKNPVAAGLAGILMLAASTLKVFQTELKGFQTQDREIVTPALSAHLELTNTQQHYIYIAVTIYGEGLGEHCTPNKHSTHPAFIL